MELPEEQIHSFIIRVWLEENVIESRPVQWRGHITHVLSSQRAYVTSFTQINRFIAGYLQPLAKDSEKFLAEDG